MMGNGVSGMRRPIGKSRSEPLSWQGFGEDVGTTGRDEAWLMVGSVAADGIG